MVGGNWQKSIRKSGERIDKSRSVGGGDSNKNPCCCATRIFNLSGYLDSNQGPPAPKAGALAGLRYTPKYFNCRLCRFESENLIQFVKK
jgi:hypothetical protein